MNDILQYYGIIFSLTLIFLNPIHWTTDWYVCQQHWNIWACYSFWRPLCFAGVAKCGQFVGAWLHSILYMAHYKGFARAEIWHSCVQSETSSFHLLLHPEMLEMPSLCFNKNLCWSTNMTSVTSGSLDGSTSKMIMGAQESLGTVILWQQTIGSLQVFHEVDSDYWEGVSG